jgi:hypothetical protein
VSDQVGPKLSAALRAQASGLSTNSAGEAATAVPSGRGQARAKPRMPGWVVLLLAVLLGAAAGGLAGVISTW